MLTNKDIKVLADIIEYLSMLDSEKAKELYKKLDSIYYKIIEQKQKNSNNANDYNKRNKKYHSLINTLSYHRKRGNYAKIKEITKRLEVLKNDKT